MTANELAEIQAFKTEELTMWERNHTATMLRQQQAEIEALKAHPAKELTDEEITEIYKKVYVALAKELLRKAQEK